MELQPRYQNQKYVSHRRVFQKRHNCYVYDTELSLTLYFPQNGRERSTLCTFAHNRGAKSVSIVWQLSVRPAKKHFFGLWPRKKFTWGRYFSAAKSNVSYALQIFFSLFILFSRLVSSSLKAYKYTEFIPVKSLVLKNDLIFRGSLNEMKIRRKTYFLISIFLLDSFYFRFSFIENCDMNLW